MTRSRSFIALALLAGMALSAGTAQAEKVKLQLSELYSVQTRTPGEAKTDQVYFLVDGHVAGKAIQGVFPKKGTMKASAKVMAITKKKPVVVFDTDLKEGEFAFVTVAMFFGEKPTATGKAFFKARAAATKAVAGMNAKTIDRKGVATLAAAANKAHLAFVKTISKTLGKDADSYGGLFDVIVANVDGRITKRATPVGLSSGQHYGVDAKVYTKLKYSRDNVLVEDEGDYYEVQLGPTTDDKDMVYLKMLETAFVKGADGKPVRNVTDYIVGLQLLKGDKGRADTWEIDGEHPGPSIVHDYWDWAY